MGNDLSLDAQAFLWSQQGDIDPVLLGMMGRDPASSIFDYPTAYSRLKYAQEKYKRSPSSKTIGLKSPTLIVRATGTMTDNTDFTLYPDRAILNLVNDTAGNVTVTGISIRGLPVKQYTDAYRWINVDYDDIDKRGEVPLVIENEYICTKDQLEDVGDYTTKLAVSNPEYTLTIPGCHYEYNIGDVWHLTLSYTIQGQVSECENIDTDVEIRSISIDRQVGSIGNTTILVSPPPGEWTKTTNRRARLISLGMANLLNNRGNVISVGSSTWTGQADYYCDGTDDDVQIQAAIDYLYDRGGGLVLLTDGIFSVKDTITLKANVSVIGEYGGTIILKQDTSASVMFTYDNSQIHNIRLSSLIIDGNSSNLIHTDDFICILGVTDYSCTTDNIIVQNIDVTYSSSGEITLYGFQSCVRLSNCSALNLYCKNTGSGSANIAGYYDCATLSQCYASEIGAYVVGTGIAGAIAGFYYCATASGCSAVDNYTTTGNYSIGFWYSSKLTNCVSDNDGLSIGFVNCKSLQQCQSSDTIKYDVSYADAGTSNAAADTSAGGYNS